MPKPTKGPRLGGSSSHQKALLANLATSLFEHGRIKTTEPKARALRPYAEKLITHAKKGTLHNRREVIKKIRDKDVVHTLFAEIGPFFADRNGGYTRIIKVEARKGDNAPMAVIELVREKTVTSEADRAPPRRRVAKKAAPVAAAAAPQAAVEPEAAVGPTADEDLAEEADSRRTRRSTRLRGRGRRSRRLRKPSAEEVAEAEAEADKDDDAKSSSDIDERCPPSIPVAGLFVFALDIAYDGTEFAGWAAQTGQRTVAGVLDEALSTVFRTPVQLRAAGRTDTGVHATGQVAHVDVPADAIAARLPAHPSRPASREFLPLVRRLSRFLPADVRVRDIVRAPAGFDARFSALRRHYEYRLSTAPYGVDPQQARYVTPWPRPLDVDAMAAASRELVGLHDFAAFCRHREGATTIRDLQRLDWSRDGRSHHRLCHRRRVLLVDGALAGRRAAGGRGGPPRTGVVRRPADRVTSLQRLRGGTAARPDAGRRGLPARRSTRGAHHGHPRPAPHRLDVQPARDEVGGLIHHARVDVRLGGVIDPVRLPRVGVGGVADRIGAVAQLDGPLGVERVEVRDGPHPCDAVAEQGDRGDLLVHARGQRVVEAEEPERHRQHHVGDCGAQRIAAEHQAGVGAGFGHVLDVRAHVVGADVDLVVGGVAHRVDADVLVRPSTAAR